MILVTAAHGNQGRLLVPKLLAADQLVRACVRTQASAEHLRGLGAHEIVVGDISDPAVLARAIRGVQKVHHIGPTIHPRVRATVSAWARPSLGAGARPFHAGSPDGAGVGESVLGDAAERGVDAQRERVGGWFPERDVGILHDEHELNGAGWRRRPAEGG